MDKVIYLRRHPDYKYDLMQYIIISLKSIFLKTDLTLEVTVGWFWLLCLFLVVRKVLHSFVAERPDIAVWGWYVGFFFVIFPTLPTTRVHAYRSAEIKSY